MRRKLKFYGWGFENTVSTRLSASFCSASRPKNSAPSRALRRRLQPQTSLCARRASSRRAGGGCCATMTAISNIANS
jgi:hypothetical protein